MPHFIGHVKTGVGHVVSLGIHFLCSRFYADDFMLLFIDFLCISVALMILSVYAYEYQAMLLCSCSFACLYA